MVHGELHKDLQTALVQRAREEQRACQAEKDSEGNEGSIRRAGKGVPRGTSFERQQSTLDSEHASLCDNRLDPHLHGVS